MSWPQHIGDLILPAHLGHLDICTLEPSSLVSVSFTSGSLQSEQLASTPMLQTLQRYVAMLPLLNQRLACKH